jgi:NitT/TauT family transport system permease protein
MINKEQFELIKSKFFITPNIWDLIVLTFVLGVLAIIAWGASQMITPYQLGQEITISLDPKFLPEYTIKTVLRMLIAMIFSLIFTFTVAPLAAKNRGASKLILSFIDIMQSIPVLGLLSITVVGFIKLFPNSMLGPESASIFAVFTAQVWNITMSLYQSLRTVPINLQEAANMYQLSAWQRFWSIEVPFGTQGLLWNCMMSMSAGWFFVVLSETIMVSNQNIALPGIGSYISKAIAEENFNAMWYAIVAMFLVILLYDQLLFRPLLAWANKFTIDVEENSPPNQSWFLNLLAKTLILKKIEIILGLLLDLFINRLNIILKKINTLLLSTKSSNNYSQLSFLKLKNKVFYKLCYLLWQTLIILIVGCSLYFLTTFIIEAIDLAEILHVFFLGLITALKVIVLIILASLIWVPIGVWIGLNKKASLILQPIIQFLAAFPANFLYPIVIILIMKYSLNKNIYTAPLMILGTQWYILFNVIAAMNAIPKEIFLTTQMLRLKGILWWKKVILPAIFPFYVTGAMTAAGGCWNASIVAEFVKWGDNTITSLGLGSYITEQTNSGDFRRLALGICIMCIYVMLFNKLVWRKLYQLASSRFNFN